MPSSFEVSGAGSSSAHQTSLGHMGRMLGATKGSCETSEPMRSEGLFVFSHYLMLNALISTNHMTFDATSSDVLELTSTRPRRMSTRTSSALRSCPAGSVEALAPPDVSTRYGVLVMQPITPNRTSNPVRTARFAKTSHGSDGLRANRWANRANPDALLDTPALVETASLLATGRYRESITLEKFPK